MTENNTLLGRCTVAYVEGFVSLEMGRRFVGFELKPSYFNCAVKNLTNAQATKQKTLLEVGA